MSRAGVRLLRPSDRRVMPWRNGQGVTTEIAIEHGGTPDRFLWRVSMAEVAASGPFSDFSGYDRTLVLIEGGGMALDFGEGRAALLERPFDMAAFSGDWPTACRLTAGPIRDLNAIVDRARADHRVAIRRGGRERGEVKAGATTLLVALAGAPAVEVEGERVPMGAGDALRLDGACTFELDARTSVCAQIDVLPR